MRVTNIMLANNLLRNMWFNMERLAECQDRLSSGKEIRRPSDDPVRVAASLALRSSLGEIEQYARNVDDARTWMEVTDDALASAIEVLQTARERAVAGANGTLPQASRDAIAQEVKQLRDQLMQIANTNLGGRYIFGGTKTDKEPYVYENTSGTDINGIKYQGNSGDIEYEIAPKISVCVNFDGQEVFGDNNNKDVFAVLGDLYSYLKKGETANISASIGDIDKLVDNLIARRGELGARENRMEMSADRLSQDQVQQTNLLSQAEDADIAKAIIDLKNQENAYRTTLAAGARIIMPTLIDFLR
ncbi:MAG TPA: flagellar hook-associated protein FlgL [Syntrophomonadaceae bacterium]|nr:flagellar hook-associated protein FlgL [Syntrophomonadaceae bacterium]